MREKTQWGELEITMLLFEFCGLLYRESGLRFPPSFRGFHVGRQKFIMDVYVLVTGSRDWSNKQEVEKALKRCEVPNQPMVLVQGDCSSGADHMAKDFARKRGWRVVSVRAQWKRYGRAAGPRRNQEMLDTFGNMIDWFLVFSKQYSRGTEDTLSRIRAFQNKKNGASVSIYRA